MLFRAQGHLRSSTGRAAAILCLLLASLAISSLADAGDAAAPGDLGSWLGSIARAVEVRVTGRVDDRIEFEEPSPSLHPGLRLDVFREGAPFTHPVTGDVVGRLQNEVGRIEVQDSGTGPGGKVLRGSAEPGDLARLTAARLKLVLTYPAGTNPVVLDQVFRSIGAGNRFDVRDGGAVDAPGRAGTKALPGDDLVLHVETSADSIHGRVFWAEDGHLWDEISVSRSRLAAAAIPEAMPPTGIPADASMPSAGPSPYQEERIPWVHFPIPHRGYLLAAGDLDGDGSAELLIHQGSKLHVYRTDRLEIKPLGEIDVPGTGRPFSLGIADTDHDGRAEIFLTSVRDLGEMNTDTGRVETQEQGAGSVVTVIEHDGAGAYRTVWSGKDLFVRVVEGDAYAQGYSADRGLAGPVRKLEATAGAYAPAGDQLKLPAGTDLFGFVPLGDGLGVFTAEKRLALVDAAGHVSWMTDVTFGVSSFSYVERESPWAVGKRVMKSIPPVADSSGRLLFLARNISLSNTLKDSLAIRSSELLTVEVATGRILEKGDEGTLGGELRDVVRLPDGRIAALVVPVLGWNSNIFDKWDYFTGECAIVVVDPGRI